MERLYTLKEAEKLLELRRGYSALGYRWKNQGCWDSWRRRRIPESEIKRILGLKEERAVLGYVRVSPSTQKDYLERQLIANYAEEKGYGEIQTLSDIGSGLNENGKVSKIIVAYEYRLTRFGF